MKFKNIIKVGSFAFAFMTLLFNQSVNAQEAWRPRSVAEISNDLKTLEEGSTSYTVKWGDTLYNLSLATNISIEQLAKINKIENIRLIEVGTTMYFNEDHSVITVSDEKGETVKSYSTENGEETETPDEVSKVIETTVKNEQADESAQKQTVTPVETVQPTTTQIQTTQSVNTVSQVNSSAVYSLDYFMFHGVIHWNGYMFTYYSQSVLPGGGLSIPGRHVNAQGYVVDGDGYIVLANNAPIGTIIDTPFGAPGKVYDRGTYGNHFDVYIR